MAHLHEDVGDKLAGRLVQYLWEQRLALVSLHVNLDDHGVGLDAVEDFPGGGGHGGRPDHLVPLVLPGVQTLLGDQVGGAGHVLVLGLGHILFAKNFTELDGSFTKRRKS